MELEPPSVLDPLRRSSVPLYPGSERQTGAQQRFSGFWPGVQHFPAGENSGRAQFRACLMMMLIMISTGEMFAHGLSCTYLTDNPGENTLGPGNQDGASGFDYCSPTLPPCLYLGVNSYGTGLLSSLHLTSLPTGPDAPALWNLHSWKHLTQEG